MQVEYKKVFAFTPHQKEDKRRKTTEEIVKAYLAKHTIFQVFGIPIKRQLDLRKRVKLLDADFSR